MENVSLSYLESLILGVIQGLGEFLPISSSAHLVIAPLVFNFKDPGLTFNVALHFGTLLAIIFYFWRDWIEILTGSVRHWVDCKDRSEELCRKDKGYHRLFFFLVVATVPGAIGGYFLEEMAETAFRHPLLVGANMTLLGILLLIADKIHSGLKNVEKADFWDSLFIGISQVLALVPGVSRAGITMTAGLLRGFDRVSAARFSFLMAAPITFGACVLEFLDFFSGPITGPDVLGIFASALVGFLSIKYLLKYIQSHSFRIFVYYRFAFSIFVFIFYFVR